jgi:hypothetical protein
MVGAVQVGALTIEGVSDGSLAVPPTALFNKTDQDWLQHSQFLDDDGMLPVEMGGFLVRSGERLVLVDTGIGRARNPAVGDHRRRPDPPPFRSPRMGDRRRTPPLR